MPRAVKLSALAALFAAGFLAAAVIVSGGRAQVVATRTETTVETETTTAPGTTETVELTTTRRIPLPTSTAESASNDDTPTWVWVLLGALALGVVVLLVVMLTRRGGGGGGVSVEERQRHLDGAVGSWVAQGWAVESQAADSAVLRRGGDLMLVSVDQAGHVSTQPLPAPPT